MTVGLQRFGVSVQSEVSVLREECRLPFRLIQRYLKGRFGLDLSVGQIVALTRGVAQRGRQEYARLQEESQPSGVRGRDRLAGRRPQWLPLELQHTQGALLLIPLEPEQARG